MRSAPPKKKKEEDKEAAKQKEMKNQKADFALELDDMSDKVSDWDDKPKDTKKKEKSPKSSDKKKKKEVSDKSDDYNDNNWDMSASYNELQLEDKGEQKKQADAKKSDVPVTNVKFDEVPNNKEKETELKIDFFGT